MIDCFNREIWDVAPREVELVYRVIQWGAGNNAQVLIRAVHQHPDLELAGCRVSEEKDGIDVGVLAGIGPIGISATRDAQSLVDTDADVVLFLPAMLPDTTESDREDVALLRSGKSVISLTGDHSMPAAAENGFGEAVEDVCRIGDSTFTATGVNPGFIAERLPPTLTGLWADVTAVTIAATYDCSNSTAALLFDTMGFGLELKDWSPESCSDDIPSVPVGRGWRVTIAGKPNLVLNL
jgi:hypothetical protein